VVALAACSAEQAEPSDRDVVSQIPWAAPETARYRLLQGEDVRGSGVLTIRSQDGAVALAQSFQFPDQEITDDVIVLADPATLNPQRTERVIDGPEGERICEAEYADNTVTVDQRAEDAERTDEFAIPARRYDTWLDLFLWRTIEFRMGFEIVYSDVLTCSLSQPEVLIVGLEVKGLDEISVPAGRFQAWRVEIRSGGHTQKAWYAEDPVRTLLRYDNGDLVFELESVE
jgi:hypothetical protein